MVDPRKISLRRPSRMDGWCPTFTGTGFYPIVPRVEDVRIQDIARGLAYKYRFGGHSDPPITVAEHSVLVSRVIEILWPKSKQMLPGLLHDACEAFTQDIQGPLRAFIKVSHPNGQLITWGDMERSINQVVGKALGIKQDFYSSPEVEAADILTLVVEKASCPNLRVGNWGLPRCPTELQDLKVEFLSPQTAFDTFLGRYHALTS
jgi:uncharacterized protein